MVSSISRFKNARPGGPLNMQSLIGLLMTVVISLWLFIELNMIQLILQFAWLSRRKRISINSKSSSRPKNVKVVVGKTVLSALIGKPICFDIVNFLSNVCRQSGELAGPTKRKSSKK
jgi:hypothetical protein